MVIPRPERTAGKDAAPAADVLEGVRAASHKTFVVRWRSGGSRLKSLEEVEERSRRPSDESGRSHRFQSLAVLYSPVGKRWPAVRSLEY
jgi:hypothetical protein